MKGLVPLLLVAILLSGGWSGGSARPTPVAPRPASLLLAEVHYHAHRDTEYVVLFNEGGKSVDLRGWRLTDGEGVWRLSGRVPPRSPFLIAQNATALHEDAGLVADLCLVGCPHRLTMEGRFALNNGGDQVLLLDRGSGVVDVLRYGTSEPAEGWEGDGVDPVGRGRLARRRAGPRGLQDTDTAADWTWNRTFRLGPSLHPAGDAARVRAQPVVAGDGALDRLVALLGAARRQVILAGFTLTNARVVEALEAALWRGVWVQVGLEGRPPGGWEERQEALLDRLGAAGARVLLMEPAPGTGFRRYAFHHAKYVVVDGTWVLLGSENFSENGFPDAGEGNRGWGALVEGPDLAASLLSLAAEDWNASRSDIRVRFEGKMERESGPPSGGPPAPQGPWADATVRLLLSPDNALSHAGLPGLLRRARTSLDVELFYLRQAWGDRGNPLVDGLVDAARRGVRVRVLLDGSAYNLEGKDDNDEAVRRLNRVGWAEGVALEARLLTRETSGEAKLHNKGLLVDGREAWISSMNWNAHGAYENREAGLHLISRSLASAYGEAFEADWVQGVRPVEEGPNAPEGARPRLLLALASAAAALLWFRMLRMGEERTNKRPRMKRRAGAAAHRRGGD